jgi:two-component system, sensor histidine kinase
MADEKRLDLESSLFWELWRHSPDNMFILRVAADDYYIMNANRAQKETVEVLHNAGQSLRSLLPADFYDLVTPNYKRCVDVKHSIQYEESEQFTSSELRYWSTMLCPILDAAGEVAYIFGISRSITDLKHAQARAECEAAEAERANRVKTAFLANMSHEMRTPLNGIRMAADLLVNSADEAERHELCSIISNATEAMTRLTSDILDYARIDAGQLKLEQRPFVLADVMDDVQKLLHSVAQSRGLTLVFAIDRLPVANLVGDAGRLKQVLLNLVGNAVKFTPAGSVSVRSRFMGYQGQNLLLQFEVEDSGIGIHEADLARLFQPFSQVDDSTTRRFQGSGLGLAISKDLVEKMGGSICVRSELDVGSCFSFSIPFEPCRTETCLPEQQQELGVSVAGVRLLLVEDNPINQMVTRKLLEKAGVLVAVVANGALALEVCQQQDFDAVLMDWHMPVMDGLEATRQIRLLSARWLAIPVIGLTASALPEDRAICLAAGMDEVVTKPVNAATLLRVLGQLLGKGLGIKG